MMSINLSRMIRLRGYSGMLEFLRAIGMPDCQSRRFRNDPKTISFKRLEKLCWELRCTPNELLEWEPDAKQSTDESHPLRQLIASKEVEKLQHAVQNIDPSKVAKALVLLKELEKGE